MRAIYRLAMLSVSVGAIIWPFQVLAQSSTASGTEQESVELSDAEAKEIIVTGTLIRGIAPAGANVIGVSKETIEATGAANTNQILSNLPQVGNFFNSVPTGVSPTSGANNTTPIARPNLRNLPGANTSGGAQTLVLIDGHRVVPMGTQQLAIDPDIIAPGVIARVEALTDGGSAVYGSDALGGVINFITRRKFDGVQANARYGFADDLKTFDADVTVGKDWGSGSAYVSFNYLKHDSVFGADRDFVRRVDWTGGVPGTPVGRNCGNPNISAGAGANARTYVVAGSGLAQGPLNTCDPSDDQAIYPTVEQRNVFASFVQDLSDSLTVEIKGYYALRETVGNGGTLGTGTLNSGATGTVTLQPSNPAYRPLPVGDVNFGLPQVVNFNYGPALGFRSNVQQTDLDTWNITPSVTYKFGGDWQLRGSFNYGTATIDYRNTQINAAAQNAAVTAGTLNPYNIAATSQTVLAGLIAFQSGTGKNEYFNYRAIVDGPLLQLPAGDVRVAAGAEYSKDNFQRRDTTAAYVLPAFAQYSQSVKSVFGELQVPVLGGKDGGVELNLNASARYDKYNDFGSTFNPKFGATFKPFEQLTIRGTWGKSFNAPSAPDQLGPRTAAASLVPGAFLSAPSVVPGVCGGSLAACSIAGTVGVFLGSGAVAGLTPQKATNWSVGADFEPVEGVTLTASYYNIDLNGTIGRPITGTGLGGYYNNFPELWIYRPTGQQVATIIAGLQNPANTSFTLLNPTSTAQALVSSGGGAATPVGVILDTLVRNLGSTKLDGIDFSANVTHETGFGSIDARVGGNYRLNQTSQLSATSALLDDLSNDNIRITLSATLGATVGGFRAQGTWNHSGGFRRPDAGAAGAFGQTRIGAFDVFNLFFKYDFNDENILKDLALTLNVNNVLDRDAPAYFSTGLPGYEPSKTGTLGRLVQFGISKKF